MIFNEDFDKSLWLIISGDKENRDAIVSFIKSIPVPLYERMSMAIANYQKCKGSMDVFDIDEDEFKEEFVVSNFKYYYYIDPFLSSLVVGKLVLNDCNQYIKTIEIKLFSRTTYNNISVFGEEYLGSISSSSYLNMKRSYDLISTVFGMMVVTSINDKKWWKKYRRVDTNKMSDDVKYGSLIRARKK